MTTKPPNQKGRELRLLSIKRRRANWQTPRHKPLPRQLERPLQDRENAHLGLDIGTGQLICLRPRVITRTVTRGMAGPSATPPACRSRDAPPAGRLQAAHAVTFIRPQVELTMIGRGRLHACAQTEDAKADWGEFGGLPSQQRSVQHQAALASSSVFGWSSWRYVTARCA